MSETRQTLEADPNAGTLGGDENATVEATNSTEGPAANVPNEQATELALIEEATGRQFSTVEDAKKYLRNLNSMVGDYAVAEARKKADLADAIVQQFAEENSLTPDEAREQLQGMVRPKKSKPNPTGSTESRLPPEAEERMAYLERKAFTAEHPEAAAYLDKVERYAKASNMSLEGAYNELYGDVFKDERSKKQEEALRKEKMGASVAASSATPATPEVQKSKELLANYRKTGNQEILHEAMKARRRETKGSEAES